MLLCLGAPSPFKTIDGHWLIEFQVIKHQIQEKMKLDGVGNNV